MSANATVTLGLSAAKRAAIDKERGHRIRLYGLYALSISINLAIFIYGFDYYKLSSVDRPFSPKHHLLRPSGPIGLYIGIFGVLLFAGIFLYPIRKRWPWLATKGSTRHWLDIHVLMGLTAPFIIAFHSTLKFRGIAGMAFWIMFAVSASGVVGRYLYAQIPRSLNTAELSRKELQELQAQLANQLAAQNLLPEAQLRALLRLPSVQVVNKLPVVIAIIYMMILDVVRFFRVGIGADSAQSTFTVAGPSWKESMRPEKKLRFPNGFSSSRAPRRSSISGTSSISLSVTHLPCCPCSTLDCNSCWDTSKQPHGNPHHNCYCGNHQPLLFAWLPEEPEETRSESQGSRGEGQTILRGSQGPASQERHDLLHWLCHLHDCVSRRGRAGDDRRQSGHR